MIDFERTAANWGRQGEGFSVFIAADSWQNICRLCTGRLSNRILLRENAYAAPYREQIECPRGQANYELPVDKKKVRRCASVASKEDALTTLYRREDMQNTSDQSRGQIWARVAKLGNQYGTDKGLRRQEKRC
ncbi:hypothetical protein HYALB_00008658 [Hymenoscyphus albidus]|uniref:Uncharacterized protein n=1 Tax=Hymenoscyphus albidus TaxID=595503 RepID=A0A9N9Q378_9HELO|nr:hypothetical protein HYALB_00008658 [Hymenoscyphus albidus]